MRRLGRLAWEVLRELADERPYQRGLKAQGRRHSAEEWRRFTERRYEARFKQPKCC